MREELQVRHLMPLMREFGSLARRRVGSGVTPLEYQRYLDLKRQIGLKFSKPRATGISAKNGRGSRSGRTRLVVSYQTRAALIASIIENIPPAGLLVSTPFAAEVGTRFLLRVCLDEEDESAEFPAIAVTSMTQGAHTLSTTAMGMGLKIEKTNVAQSAGLSKFFDHALDEKLGWAD